MPIFAWNVRLYLKFSSRDLSSFPFYRFPLCHCLVHLRRVSSFSILFFGILHSSEYIFPFLLCLSLFFSAICKASSDNRFALLHLFFLEMVLATVSYTMLWTSIHSSSSSLSNLKPWLCLSLPLYSHKGFELSHTWMVSRFFPTFFKMHSSTQIAYFVLQTEKYSWANDKHSSEIFKKVNSRTKFLNIFKYNTFYISAYAPLHFWRISLSKSKICQCGFMSMCVCYYIFSCSVRFFLFCVCVSTY